MADTVWLRQQRGKERSNEYVNQSSHQPSHRKRLNRVLSNMSREQRSTSGRAGGEVYVFRAKRNVWDVCGYCAPCCEIEQRGRKARVLSSWFGLRGKDCGFVVLAVKYHHLCTFSTWHVAHLPPPHEGQDSMEIVIPDAPQRHWSHSQLAIEPQSGLHRLTHTHNHTTTRFPFFGIH